MNKIYILITNFIIMFFIFSCKNVNILNPNENDVEVFYVDAFADPSGYGMYYNNIVEYRIKTNKSSGNIEMIPDMQFKIKDYQNDFKNIYCDRVYAYNSLRYMQKLIDNYGNVFEIRFIIPFTNFDSPYIDYISFYSKRMMDDVRSYKSGLNIVAIETNNKLVFDWNVGSFEGCPTNVQTPLEFNDDEFKTYNYLTDEENLILSFITYTVKVRESLITNGYVKY